MARTLGEMQEIVEQLAYKDWRFSLNAVGEGRLALQVRFTDNGKPWSGRKWDISRFATDSEIVQTALKAVLTAEEHEAREKFLYRGRAIFGPHYDVDQLWELAGSPEALDAR